MIDTKELRQKILDLAIQGKLTEQLPEDGTGEELFQQIQQEKRKLEAEGKIKKEKALPPVSEDEIPFDIPDNWKWVALGNIASVYGGKRIPAGRSLTTEDTGQKYIRISDMKNMTVDIFGLLYVPKDIIASISRYIINKEDVYITVAGTIGKVGKIPSDIDGANLTENADRIVFSGLEQDWLIMCLSSSLIQKQIERVTTSVAQPKLAIKKIEEFVLPLPPLAEQKRIVEKIEAALSLLEIIDNLQNHYSNNEIALKRKLIDAAIHGKLTEQLPEDGTAEKLYQQIQQEKRKLEAEGKIKKAKVLPPVSEDEIPFDIPGNWKWIRLFELGIFSGGKTPSMDNKDYWNNGTINWITSKDMKRKYINSSEMKITKEGAAELNVYPTKTILFVVRSGILRRSFPVAILTEQGTINQDLKALSLFVSDMCEYIYFVLKGLESKILFRYTKDGTTVNNIMFDEFLTMPIPLPPLAEQKRIVAKLEELLPLCE